MVYLIHLETKLHHSQHYIGYSADEKFAARIRHHENNRGCAFLRAVNKAGIKWKVVRQWPNEDGNFERMLKKRKQSWRLCPCCNKNVNIKINNFSKKEAIDSDPF